MKEANQLMRHLTRFLLICAMCSPLFAQIGVTTSIGPFDTFDASTSKAVKPFPVTDTAPSTCLTGQFYWGSTAQTLHFCSSPNTWLNFAAGTGTGISPLGAAGIPFETGAGAASRQLVYSDVVHLWTTCTTGYLKYDGTCSAASGTGTPGGSNGQIQINNSGAFGGIAAPAGAILGTTDTQTTTGKTVDGVTPATFASVDPTSSIQGQFNAVPHWIKYVVAVSGANWTVNGTSVGARSSSATQSITLVTTAARTVFSGLVIKNSVQFAITGSTAIATSVGISSAVDSLMLVSGDTYNPTQTVSISNFYVAGGAHIVDFAADPIVLYVSTVGNTVSAITAGTIEVDLFTSVLP